MSLAVFAIVILVVSATYAFLCYWTEKYNYEMYQKEPLDVDMSTIAAELGLDKAQVYASITKWQSNLKERER